MDFGSAFDELADSDFWVDAAMVFIGFIAPMLARNVVENNFRALPDEVYGAGTALVAVAMDQDMIAVGGGVYTVDAIAQRLKLKGQVTNLGGA